MVVQFVRQVLLSSTPSFIESFIKHKLKALTEISSRSFAKVHEQPQVRILLYMDRSQRTEEHFIFNHYFISY